MVHKNPLPRIIAIILILILTGSSGYYMILGGKESFMDCLYMTVISLSTVGYGEVIETGGNPILRIYTMVLLIFGVGILLYALGAFTAFVVEGHFSGLIKRRRMMKQISELKDHIIVCGGGDTGYYVVDELIKCKCNVVLIDINQDNLDQCMKLGDIHYIVGDATDDQNLVDANIEHARGVVIALPSDKDNLYIVMTARILNPRIRIVSVGQHEHIETKMRKAGADSIVSPNHIGGLRLASEMIRPATVEFLDRMLRSADQTLRVGEIEIREGSHMENRTIGDLHLAHKHNLVLLSARAPDSRHFQYNPPENLVLTAGYALIVMGDVEDINKVNKI